MRNWPARRASLAAALLAAAAIAPLAAQDTDEAPESLLPPGFGDPPPAEVAPPPLPGVSPTPGASPTPGVTPSDAPDEEDDEDEDGEEDEEELEPDPFDLPPEARRDPRFAGLIGPEEGGLGDEAWGRADGRYLSILMRRLDAPIASRWGSILLRRALASRAPAPAGVNGADWAAERAWLLIRMGETNAARALVQAVDVDRFTPKMFDVAMQVALATNDPGALCPMVGAETPGWPGWTLARAWCAALGGDTGTASAIVEATRRRSGRGIDLLLAEKVVNAGTGGRRSVAIQWDGVSQLNSWRYGLARATGVAIPDELLDTVGPQVRAWSALSPMLTPEERLGPAATAARLGVFSNLAYVDLLGAVGDATDPADFADTPAARLRTAYAGVDVDARLGALRQLWGEDGDADARFASLVLTARAAARIAPDAGLLQTSPLLIGAMLTAGLDTVAAGWGPIIEAAGDDGAAWALLAVGASRPVVGVSTSRADAFANDEAVKGRLLIAALAGLGRLDTDDANGLARDHGIGLGRRSAWIEAIEAATAAQQPGTVALLVAVGLQADAWRGVPPEHLYHIVRSLVAVGLEPEARMIAAEAISRA